MHLRIEKRVHPDGSVHLCHLVGYGTGWADVGLLRFTSVEAEHYLQWLRYGRPDGYTLEVERVS